MDTSTVHPTAHVADDAVLGEGTVVGPYAVIEGDVEIGSGTAVGAHSVIQSFVRIGQDNKIHPHALIGGPPQDLTFEPKETWLEIGDHNTIREGVTLHRATSTERPTRVGSGCFFMAFSHVAHDCQIGDGVVLTNGVLLAGHVEIGDQAILAGLAVVHQYVRIGSLAMVGGLAGLAQDALPYSLVRGVPARHHRLNTVGLRRAGIKGERYHALETAFRALRARKGIDDCDETPEVAHLREWLAAPSKRGLAHFYTRKSARAEG